MNSFKQCKIAAVAAILFTATGAFAANGNKVDYSAAKERIEAEYKAEKKACDSYKGNQNDVCEAQAKGKEKVARAEAEFNYSGKPSDANKLAVTRADTAYDVAKEMCDEKGGQAKDVCMTEAKASHTKALADAKMTKKVGSAAADANDDKRDADYKVAAEKCDSLGGDAKAACINAAKVKFKKS